MTGKGDGRGEGRLPRVLIILDDGQSEQEQRVAHRGWDSIIDALSAAGFEVGVATTGSSSSWHACLSSSGHPVVALNRRWRTDVIAPALALRRFLATRPPDVVYAHEVLPGVIAGVGTRLARVAVPCLYHRHHTFSSVPHEIVSRFAARLATETVAYSAAVAEAAARWDGTPPSEVRRVQPGVPEPRTVSTTEAIEVRSSLGIRSEDFVVVGVARLRREKGMDLLLEGLRLLPLDIPVHGVIVGAGSEETRLRTLSREIGRPVHFVGHQDDVSLWYAIADVVAIPSRRESLGLVALEALASGRAIVASAVGGLAETLTDETDALLHPPGDVTALARNLERCCRSKELRQRLADAGRRTYERSYTMEAMGRSMASLLDEMCRTPR